LGKNSVEGRGGRHLRSYIELPENGGLPSGGKGLGRGAIVLNVVGECSIVFLENDWENAFEGRGGFHGGECRVGFGQWTVLKKVSSKKVICLHGRG